MKEKLTLQGMVSLNFEVCLKKETIEKFTLRGMVFLREYIFSAKKVFLIAQVICLNKGIAG
jgi:hypothetical protein